MRGKIKRYLAFPVTWVAGKDVANGSIAALDRGVAGERYLLIGRPQEKFTTAGGSIAPASSPESTTASTIWTSAPIPKR